MSKIEKERNKNKKAFIRNRDGWVSLVDDLREMNWPQERFSFEKHLIQDVDAKRVNILMKCFCLRRDLHPALQTDSVGWYGWAVECRETGETWTRLRSQASGCYWASLQVRWATLSSSWHSPEPSQTLTGQHMTSHQKSGLLSRVTFSRGQCWTWTSPDQTAQTMRHGAKDHRLRPLT